MYTEKPLGISIEQDLAARQITRKHGRIFQYGTQNRSMAQVRMGLELVLNGHIGDLKEIFVWCPPSASGGSATPVLPVPEGFDYNLWQGPAPERPFSADRCLNRGHRNGIFHIYDYAIGFIAGWGAHPLDQLQWWADNAGMGIPVSYAGTGTIPTEGLFNVITNWDVECTYANGIKMRFMDHATMQKKGVNPEGQFKHGSMFVGSEGYVNVSRGAWQVFPDEMRQHVKDVGGIKLEESRNHQHNFIDAICEKRQPIANLESAVQSDIISHLSDIAIRTGDTIRWDPKLETIVDNPVAAKMMSRPMRAPWSLEA